MVVIGILTIYVNGIILLDFQKTSVKFCVSLTVIHIDAAHLSCWTKFRAFQFCALRIRV